MQTKAQSAKKRKNEQGRRIKELRPSWTHSNKWWLRQRKCNRPPSQSSCSRRLRISGKRTQLLLGYPFPLNKPRLSYFKTHYKAVLKCNYVTQEMCCRCKAGQRGLTREIQVPSCPREPGAVMSTLGARRMTPRAGWELLLGTSCCYTSQSLGGDWPLLCPKTI